MEVQPPSIMLKRNLRMDNSKSMKFNLNKLLLKATALVVMGAFLFNVGFVDLAWACSWRHRVKINSFLRPAVAEESWVAEELGERLGKNVELAADSYHKGKLSLEEEVRKYEKILLDNYYLSKEKFSAVYKLATIALETGNIKAINVLEGVFKVKEPATDPDYLCFRLARAASIDALINIISKSKNKSIRRREFAFLESLLEAGKLNSDEQRNLIRKIDAIILSEQPSLITAKTVDVLKELLKKEDSMQFFRNDVAGDLDITSNEKVLIEVLVNISKKRELITAFDLMDYFKTLKHKPYAYKALTAHLMDSIINIDDEFQVQEAIDELKDLLELVNEESYKNTYRLLIDVLRLSAIKAKEKSRGKRAIAVLGDLFLVEKQISNYDLAKVLHSISIERPEYSQLIFLILIDGIKSVGMRFSSFPVSLYTALCDIFVDGVVSAKQPKLDIQDTLSILPKVFEAFEPDMFYKSGVFDEVLVEVLKLSKEVSAYKLESVKSFEKLKKIGVDFKPILKYIINYRQSNVIKDLDSLNDAELSKIEYSGIIESVVDISKDDILKQTELLLNLSKIVSIAQAIPESKELILEEFKDWQANPSVVTFGGWALELIDAGIMPLPELLSSDESIDSLKDQIELIQKGGFDINNPIHIDLNYHLLREQIKLSLIKREISYKEFLEFVDKARVSGIKAVEEEAVSSELQREVRGLTYEGYLLREELLKIEQRAKELGRPLVVVENLSYGAVAAAPITKERNGSKHIVGTDIPVISTKVGSTECHNNEIYIREDLFNSDEIEYILKNQPIVVVIDASTSVSDPGRTSPHIPDGFKGYRNYFMAVNKALLDKVEATHFLEDRQFEGRILGDSHFTSLVEYLKEKVSHRDKNVPPYSLFFWYPGKKELYLRVNKQKAVVAPKIEDIKQIQGPSIVFIQSAIEPEVVPAHIQEGFIKGSHHSAYFDDRDHFKQFYLDYEPGYGVVLSKQMVNLSRRYFHELVSFLGKERITPVVPAPDILAARREIDTVVLDLDGSIAETDKLLSEDTLAILESLRRKGKYIIIITEDIEENLKSRIVSLASNRLKQGLSIFSSGGPKGFGFDEKGNRVYYEEYNQQGLIDKNLRQKVLNLLDNNFVGQYQIDQRPNRISPDCRIDLNNISVNRDDLALKMKALFSQESISTKVYKVGRSSIKIVLQHKADALRYMLKKKQIDESKVLIVGDQARTNQVDRELLSLFPKAVNINVGRYSASIHKLNPDIIQRVDEGIEGTKRILSELVREDSIQLAQLKNINDGAVREAHLRGERESERSLGIVKGKGESRVEDKERIEKMEKELARLTKRYPYIKVKFNQGKIDKKHPIVLIIHPNLLFDNLSLALAIQNLKEQLGENIMIVLPYDRREKVADFCQEINKLTDGLTNLSSDDFVAVPADAKPGKVVEIVKKNLEGKGLDAEGMRIKVIGPKNWVESYQMVSGVKDLIIVISEVGKGNSISRGDIALLAGLVDEGLLSKEDKDRLLKEVIMSKDRKVIVVQLDELEKKAKEAEDIEVFRKMFEKYK